VTTVVKNPLLITNNACSITISKDVPQLNDITLKLDTFLGLQQSHKPLAMAKAKVIECPILSVAALLSMADDSQSM